MFINVDNSCPNKKKNISVYNCKINNIKSTNYPPQKKNYNIPKNKKINSLEMTYNHIHTAYDKY